MNRKKNALTKKIQNEMPHPEKNMVFFGHEVLLLLAK